MADGGHTQQNTTTSALHQLGQSLAAILDPPELVKRLADAALDLSGADESLVIIDDPDMGNLSLRRRRNAAGEAAYTPIGRGGDPLAEQVMASGKMYTSSGESRDGASGRGPLIAYAPITSKGEVIGVLGVRNRPGRSAFSNRVTAELAALSGYAAIALENARFYQQAVERTMELSLLVESSNAVSSSLDLGSVLHNIARYMTRGLDTHWCIVWGLNATRRTLHKLAEYRLAVWPHGQGPAISLAENTCYRHLLEADEELCVQFGQFDSSPADRACLEKRGLRRILLLPIQLRGEIRGLVELCNLHLDGPFAPSQVAQSLRLALELAPLITRERTGTWTVDVLNVVRTMTSASGADWCTLYTWERSEGLLHQILTYGTGIWPDPAGPRLALDRFSTVRIVVGEQRITVLRSTDPAIPEAERALFDGIGESALLLLPLVFKGKTVGLVQLFDLDPGREFSPREMGLAHTLANQAALALENANLVRDLQRSLAEQKRMQSRLVHAARLSALGEMSAVIAHQINNPLTTVLADAEMLVQDIPPGDPSHESARAILRAGQRAKRVVERLLTIARADEEPRPLDVNQTIEDTLELVTAQIIQAGITLEVDLARGLPPIRAIPGQMEDVWMNLLINARDAIVQKSSEGGHIKVTSRLGESGKMVEVRITDNGCGIPGTQLDQVFDPFFTTKPRGKGTGLGLYICRQIVSEHNGRIWIEGAPGGGTCVVVELPVSESAPRDEEIR